MAHPAFRMLMSQPTLLADHLEAYAELVAEQTGVALKHLRRLLLLRVIALCTGMAATMLGGIALMLWAVSPPAAIHAPWALLAVPLVPLFACVIALIGSSKAPGTGSFDVVREQLAQDVSMLRELASR